MMRYITLKIGSSSSCDIPISLIASRVALNSTRSSMLANETVPFEMKL